MKPVAPLRPLIVIVIAAALIAAGFLVRGAATARDASAPAPLPVSQPPAAQGVVCFGTVDLEFGTTSLGALQPGRVAEVLVRENQVVPKGMELVRLDDAGPQS